LLALVLVLAGVAIFSFPPSRVIVTLNEAKLDDGVEYNPAREANHPCRPSFHQ
jgi:hypothetical protein